MKNKDMITQPADAKEQYYLGWLYANAVSSPQDYEQAVKWFTKSAEQGHPSAQYHLGWRYENGRGVTRDPKQAVKWLSKSANQGNSYAQSYLDDMIPQVR